MASFECQDRGLSLCIQGTSVTPRPYFPNPRFIPVHTGNIHLVGVINALEAVYPCAYREHLRAASLLASANGLSLCIQGTFWQPERQERHVRFIPVHTGNMIYNQKIYLQWAVYPCAYREH